MKFAWSTWACLALSLLCTFRAIQLHRASTADLSPHTRQDSSGLLLSDSRLPSRYKADNEQDFTMDDTPSNLFYFVQVSDLHLSKFSSQGHTVHFLHFLKSVMPMLRPEFVVVTGDLTDAKDAQKIKTEQYKDEWEMYKAAVDQGAGDVVWYDMKGNHDAFNLASWESSHNLYRDYGKSAKLVHDGEGVYAWDVVKPYGQYHFVAADATPKRGPSRPLNFFGYLTSAVMDRLASAILEPTSYNHTFMFSHYPTTTMVFGKSSTGKTFQDLASRFSIYFCGHLHRLAGGLGDVLKRYNYKTDSLELELGDMKDHGAYRIVAIDHDLISFTDIDLPIDQIPATDQVPELGPEKQVPWPAEKLQVAPVVVITNPKDSRYWLAYKEPFHLPKRSTHIRFLIFSEADPSELRVRIFVDDKRHPFPATFVGNASLPLWVSTWDPNDFDDLEPHTIRVEAVFGELVGQTTTLFRMDAIREGIHGGFGEWLVGAQVSSMLRTFSLLGVFILLLLLLVPRVYQELYNENGLNMRILVKIHAIDQEPDTCGPFHFIQRQTLIWTLRFLQLPSDQPVIWYGFLGYTLVLVSMPWFRAEFIPSGDTDAERFGTFYMWGLVFGQEWIPLADTWMFAFTQLFFSVGLFLVLFGWRATDGMDLHCRGIRRASDSRPRQLNERAWFKGIEVLYWLWRASGVVRLASFYGGVYPTLVLNVWSYWLVFVGVMLVRGKGGFLASRSRSQQRVPVVLDGCSACQEPTLRQAGPQVFVNTQEDLENHLDPLLVMNEGGESSGNSSSTTLFKRSSSPKQD